MSTETLTRFSLRVDRDALLPAVVAAGKVVPGRTTMPILSHFLLRTEPRLLRITATDLDLAIETEVEVATDGDAALAVPGGTLRDIVRKLESGAEITIEAGEKNEVHVRAGRSRFTLPTFDAGEFPDLAAGEMTHRFELPAEDLARALAATAFAMSSEETRYYLNGIFLHIVDEGVLAFVATNGTQLATFLQPAPEGATGMPDVIIPRLMVAQLKNLVEKRTDAVRFEVSPTKISAAAGTTRLVSKLIDGRFPDYARVIPKHSAATLKVDRQAFMAAVDRVATISDQKGRGVKLSLTTDRVHLSVHQSDGGTAEDELEALYTGKEMQIGFNSGWLRDIADALATEKIELGVTDPGSSALIGNTDRPEVLFVLMPMRL